jgi:hypothetical protein
MRMPVHRLLLEGQPTGLVALPCEGFVARAVGCWRWGGRVPRGMALWLAPCRAIHTVGLPRPIELAFCDGAGRILRLVAPVAPHRIAWCRAAAGAFELRTGTALRLGLRAGQRLQVERRAAAQRPAGGEESEGGRGNG